VSFNALWLLRLPAVFLVELCRVRRKIKMNKKIVFLCILSTITLSPFVFSSDWGLVWQDEFNGSISSVWSFDIGYGNNGWGNNEWQYYTPENAIIGDSTLIIRATLDGTPGRRDGSIKSAKLITQNKFSFTYGKIEARIKLPRGKGLWPAFWMLGTNITEVGWPRCGEIDIMENVNGESTIHGTAHWGENGTRRSYGCSVPNVDTDEFNIYTVIWDKNYLRWELNGDEYCVLDITAEKFYAFHESFYIILNLAVGGNWPGDPDETTPFPADMEIDYVRVYTLDGPQIGFTPQEMRFRMDKGDASAVSPQTLNINNTGSDTLDAITVKPDVDWLDITPIDNIGNSQSFEVQLNDNANTLLYGSDTSTLTLETSNAPPVTVEVQLQVGTNLVLYNIVNASSVEPNPPGGEDVSAGNVNDGEKSTRWLSEADDPQWISIHLNRIFLNRLFSVEAVKLFWDDTFAKEYEIHLSNSSEFTEYDVIAVETDGDGGVEYLVTDSNVTGRFIRLYGISRGGEGGYSLQEFEVYGRAVTTSVSEDDYVHNVVQYTLQTAPNPFNMGTTVYFSIPEKQRVDIDLFTVKGQMVKNILAEERLAGNHRVELNAYDLSSGVYFLRLMTVNRTISHKIILQK
jgi:beta-glucanase (GH16 family)